MSLGGVQKITSGATTIGSTSAVDVIDLKAYISMKGMKN